MSEDWYYNSLDETYYYTADKTPIPQKQVFYKYISQYLDGTKTVDGRLNRGYWKTLVVGNLIVFYYGNSKGLFRVVDITPSSSYCKLYDMYGSLFMPSVTSPRDANIIYSDNYDQDEIDSWGVVGIVVTKVDSPSS